MLNCISNEKMTVTDVNDTDYEAFFNKALIYLLQKL